MHEYLAQSGHAYKETTQAMKTAPHINEGKELLGYRVP